MLTYHVDNERHILEVTISGSISKQELNEAIQKFEGPLREWDDIRILKRIDSFTGIEFAALIDDLKFAYNNFSNYKKISKVAVVTDQKWIEKISSITKNLIPGEVKIFEQEDIEDARSWLH